jgi:hypothetical protein
MDRLGNALEVLRSKERQFKQVANEFSGAFRDNNTLGFRDALQASRKIRRLPNNSLVPGCIRFQQITDDNQPGSDTDTGLHRRVSLDAPHGYDHFQPSANSPFGVVFVRFGIAEIGKDAIAGVRCDKAAEAMHDLSDARLIGGGDLAEVFRI